MTLDPVTLNVAFVLLSVVLGALLLFSWRLNRRVKSLAWWGAAFFLIAAGIGGANLGRAIVSYPALLIGNALGVMAYGSLYIGSRIFNGRKPFYASMMVGVVIWAAAFPFIYEEPRLRLIFSTLIVFGYAAVTAWELWRHALQLFASQKVAIVLLVLLAIFNLLRAWLGIALTTVGWIDALASRWSSEMALFLVVYAPALAFIFLSMAKESVEFEYKQAAYVDPLTGIPNRRAFLKHAIRLISSMEGKVVSCLVFDLDNFKAINDRYGHEVGDRILTAFGEVLTNHLPPQSFGRLGGEEFGAILPVNRREAVELAEAIRYAFAKAGRAIVGPDAKVTVSIGCSASAHGKVDTLLMEADAALYKAKSRGRNIVISA